VSSIGFIAGWRENKVLIHFKRDFTPSIGDFYYVSQAGRKTLLQLTTLSSWMEALTPGIEAHHESAVFEDAFTQTGLAEAFLEYDEGRGVLYTPSTLPRPGSEVYKIDPSDKESSQLMSRVSEASGEGVPACLLRAGLAPHPKLRERAYFRDSRIRLPLGRIIPKHVLVNGQTGAGKTTGVKGLIVSSIAYPASPLTWIILDRHGEYSGASGELGFRGAVEKAMAVGGGVALETVVLDYKMGVAGGGIKATPIALSDIDVPDIAIALDLSDDDAALIEDLLDALAIVVSQACGAGGLTQAVCNQFISTAGDVVTPKGDILALYLLIFDNLIRSEAAAKASGGEKTIGFHRYLLERGFSSVLQLRRLKRIITSALNIKTRPKQYGDSKRLVYVVDDSLSVFKTASFLKDPDAVSAILHALLTNVYRDSGSITSAIYRFLPGSAKFIEELKSKLREISFTEQPGLTLSDLVGRVDEGGVFIVDLSRISAREGDLVALSLARRLLEERMSKGPLEASRSPPIAVVSEEAPLYLSSERVRSVYNSFARIAREGRKFNIGLIAITQMATLMDRQILANFNTVIAMRTSHTPDLDYFSNIGIPRETLPFLNEREAYLYSVDIPIKRPIPVYIPADFEADLIIGEKAKTAEISASERVYKALTEGEDS
jgi:DNA helicase HerA-like ATPase